VNASPESVELVREHGHETLMSWISIKRPQRAFDLLSYEGQVNQAKDARKV
jgi:hypothetical protein